MTGITDLNNNKTFLTWHGPAVSKLVLVSSLSDAALPHKVTLNMMSFSLSVDRKKIFYGYYTNIFIYISVLGFGLPLVSICSEVCHIMLWVGEGGGMFVVVLYCNSPTILYLQQTVLATS